MTATVSPVPTGRRRPWPRAAVPSCASTARRHPGGWTTWCPDHRPAARRRRRQLHGGAGGAGNAGRRRPRYPWPSAMWPSSSPPWPAGGGLPWSSSPTSGGWPARSRACSHRPQRRLPPPGLLRVRGRTSGDRHCRPVPGGRHGHRAAARMPCPGCSRSPWATPLSWDRRRPDRGQLHVPAPTARGMDAPAASGPMAVVPGDRHSGGHSSCSRCSTALLAGPPPGRRRRPVGRQRFGTGLVGDPLDRHRDRVHTGFPAVTSAKPPVIPRSGRRRPLRLHGWADRAVIGVALAAFAAGFGQFGLVAALGDVARRLRQQCTAPASPTRWGCRGPSSVSVWPSSGWLRWAACPSSGRPTGSVAGPCCSAPWPGSGHDGGLGAEPGVLVVRRHLCLWAAPAQCHQRAGPGVGGRADRHRGAGLGRGPHRGGVWGGSRTHRHHRQPGFRSPRVPGDVRRWRSFRWRWCLLLRRWIEEPDRFTVESAASDHPLPVLGPVGPSSGAGWPWSPCWASAISVITGPANSFVFLYAQNVLHQPGYVTAAMVVGAGVAGLGGLLVGRWLADHLGRRPTGALAMVGLADSARSPTRGHARRWSSATSWGSWPVRSSLPHRLAPGRAVPHVRAGLGGRMVGGGGCDRCGVGLVVFGAVADAGDRFGRAAVVTFLPTALAAGLFWLVPETGEGTGGPVAERIRGIHLREFP